VSYDKPFNCSCAEGWFNEIMVQATVVFKVYWGDPKDNICKSVADIPLDFLIMGCRGLSALKRYSMVKLVIVIFLKWPNSRN